MRNKRELWKAQSQLSSTRKQARTLLAATREVRLRDEQKLMNSLIRKGLVREGGTLDDVLSLTVEDVLARRLQSMVFKKGMAGSPLQARQRIVHRHVLVGERFVTIPSYPVTRDEEGRIKMLGAVKPEPPKQEAAVREVK